MVLCGVEEPLSSSEYLYALDEATGQVNLARFALPDLNRYSFVENSRPQDDAPLVQILQRLCSSTGWTASWVVAWNHEGSGGSHIRPKVLLSKLRNAAWDAHVFETTGLATNALLWQGLESLAPSEFDVRIGGWAIVIGQPPTPKEIWDSPLRRCMQELSHTHYLRPSEVFLREIALRSRGVAYVERRDPEGHGLVMVLAQPLGLALQRFVGDGLISELHPGADAARAWL